MPSAAANGITIEYTTTGDPDHPPLLLIMGLGAQLTAWDDEFVAALVRRGFYVIRFDNRDVGRSTWFDEAGVPDIGRHLDGEAPEPAYLLSDMADDAAGLLEALGIPSAHVLGASMGGMIAQSLAIQYPERVRTLVSIMSTTGDPSVGQPHPEVLGSLLTAPPTDRAAAIDQSVKMWGVIGSPGSRSTRTASGPGRRRPTTGPFTRTARPGRWSPSWPRPTARPTSPRSACPHW